MRKGEVIAVFIIGICTFMLIHFMQNKNNDNGISYVDPTYEIVISDDTPIEEESSPEEIIANLQQEYNNKDIVAELRIDNTTFKTPIPQASNNQYYYRRLPNKQYSIIGSTYLDYRTKINDSRVLIIYGHNSSKYNMPFKVLENYYDEDYFQKHKYIELVTSEGIKTYEVFSVFVETSDFSYYTDVEFTSNSEFYEHITKLKNKSFYDTGVTLAEDDNILILQACSTHKKYKNYAQKFVLIISREVNEYENN